MCNFTPGSLSLSFGRWDSECALSKAGGRKRHLPRPCPTPFHQPLFCFRPSAGVQPGGTTEGDIKGQSGPLPSPCHRKGPWSWQGLCPLLPGCWFSGHLGIAQDWYSFELPWTVSLSPPRMERTGTSLRLLALSSFPFCLPHCGSASLNAPLCPHLLQAACPDRSCCIT